MPDQPGPMSFESCMTRSWPGISDKEAFCAAMKRGELQKRNVGVSLQIKKINEEQRLVTGWVAVVTDETGTPIIDADDHVIPIIELEKAVHEAFVESGGKGKGGDMHTQKGVLDVVESFVLTQEKRSALGLGVGPEGWIATFKVNDDETWNRVKNGERPELSMKGEGLGMIV